MAQVFGRDCVGRGFGNAHLGQRDFLELVEEPGIHAGEAGDGADAHAALKGVADVAEAFRLGRDQFLREAARLQDFRAGLLAGFKGAPCLHQRFLKGAAHGHDFADGLHLRAQRVVGAGKFFELPLGDFDDYIIDGGFKAGGRFARDVVGDLVERVADGELGGDLGDREAGGL